MDAITICLGGTGKSSNDAKHIAHTTKYITLTLQTEDSVIFSLGYHDFLDNCCSRKANVFFGRLTVVDKTFSNAKSIMATR